jgi:hypothetical protein
MRITKRGVLLGAGGALAFAAGARRLPQGALAIHDSRIPESVAFAAEARASGVRTFDIAEEEARLWRNARAGFTLARGASLVGMTRWSDWTILRGALEAQGRRVRREVRLDCGEGPACSVLALIADPGIVRARIPGDRKGALFAWSMR